MPKGKNTALNTDGLPPELVAQLSSRGELTEKQKAFIEVINEAEGGKADLDTILIGMYHKTGEVLQREKLSPALNTLIKHGHLFKSPKRQGIYSTDKDAFAGEVAEAAEGDAGQEEAAE